MWSELWYKLINLAEKWGKIGDDERLEAKKLVLKTLWSSRWVNATGGAVATGGDGGSDGGDGGGGDGGIMWW